MSSYLKLYKCLVLVTVFASLAQTLCSFINRLDGYFLKYVFICGMCVCVYLCVIGCMFTCVQFLSCLEEGIPFIELELQAIENQTWVFLNAEPSLSP